LNDEFFFSLLNPIKLIFLGYKLEKDFYNVQKDKFNISKVPDIYDSIKYDLLHNTNMLQFPHAEDLYVCSKALADLVVPQVKEYIDLKFVFFYK
jgi:hypothetical protein